MYGYVCVLTPDPPPPAPTMNYGSPSGKQQIVWIWGLSVSIVDTWRGFRLGYVGRLNALMSA